MILTTMNRFIFRIILCFFTFNLFSNLIFCEQITHSIVPLLEKFQNTSLEKYSDNYRTQVSEMLKRKNEKIRVVTYNVLFDLFDAKLVDQTYSWVNRFPNLVLSIENMAPDLLCVQEVYSTQLKDLEQALGRDYDFFVGDSDSGELNGIFYKKERFQLDQGHYQTEDLNLSSASLELPLNPKDDLLVKKVPNFLSSYLEPGRQLTLAHFYDKLTGKAFTVINTHLTFHRINSREDQVWFIEKLVSHLHAFGRSVIVVGDFNTFPNRPDQFTLPFYDGDQICQILLQNLKDTKECAMLGHIGPTTTTFYNYYKRGNGPFKSEEDSDVILDHIYVSPQISVIMNAHEPCQVNDQFPSDHMPVIADILLP